MNRETLIAVGGLNVAFVVAVASGILLTPLAGAGIGTFGLVTVGVVVVLYRHITRLQTQQKALEQQVEQQQKKTTSYRRQFEQTQNQLETVKQEISTATEDSSSAETTESTGDTAAETTPSSTPTSRSASQETDTTTSSHKTKSQSQTASVGTTQHSDSSMEGGTQRQTEVQSTDSSATSLASVVESSWEAVETQSVVLEIIDSRRLRTDGEQLESTLQNLIQAVVGSHTETGQRTNQVFTSKAIALRAQDRNPESDITLENDGGYTPQRETARRQVVRVGTTENGIYLDCTASLLGNEPTSQTKDALVTSQQRAELETIQQQVANCGWTLGVSKREGGHRIQIEQVSHA
ncbi:hypothetical protein ACFQJ7_07635 [Halovenus rubra]|uniref:Uncharacterized protein n=2 Tax=Halovenus rubra TaxID=869890 RepID=A0ACC7E2A9_9EURY|nr:hypothetical protein [Halovenus rubra]